MTEEPDQLIMRLFCKGQAQAGDCGAVLEFESGGRKVPFVEQG
jgi:hypothetical protein